VGKPLVRFREGLENNVGMDEIAWHRRETRRQTEKTNLILQPGESPAYSNSPEIGSSWKLPAWRESQRAEPLACTVRPKLCGKKRVSAP
jgi:hypothetical protein